MCIVHLSIAYSFTARRLHFLRSSFAISLLRPLSFPQVNITNLRGVGKSLCSHEKRINSTERTFVCCASKSNWIYSSKLDFIFIVSAACWPKQLQCISLYVELYLSAFLCDTRTIWWLVIKVNPLRYTLFIACKWANYFNHHLRFYESCSELRIKIVCVHITCHTSMCLQVDMLKRRTAQKNPLWPVINATWEAKQPDEITKAHSIIVSQITSSFAPSFFALRRSLAFFALWRKRKKGKLYNIMNGLNMSLVSVVLGCVCMDGSSTNWFQWPCKR